MLPPQINNFIETFSKLPSVGPRMATRLAFYLLGLDKSAFKNLASSFLGLAMLDRCGNCFFVKDTKQKECAMCADRKRDKNIIAIVEKEIDVLSLEKTSKFRGTYFLLGELAERGIFETSQKLRVEHLKRRIEKELGGKAKEIIIALNPNAFGDVTEHLLTQELKNYAERFTRLGRGLPTGAEVEFADEETLSESLEGRK